MTLRQSTLVLLVAVLYIAKTVTGVKISYACGSTHSKSMTVKLVDDKNEGLTTIGTQGYSNATHHAICSAEGTASHDNSVVLTIYEKDFVKCNFKVQGDIVRVNISVHTNDTVLLHQNSRFFTLSCDFSKPREQSVVFGFSTYRQCKVGEFFCQEKNKCMNSQYRCAGKSVVPDRCVNANNEEMGCDANEAGGYNIQVYKKFGNPNITWIEYRGVSYFLKDQLSTEENPRFPPLVVKYSEARVNYTSPGTSTCKYNTVGQFNADFNSLITDNKATGSSCLDYFKGLLSVLLDMCKDMTSKATTNAKRREYVHQVCLKDSEKSRSDCAFSAVSRADDLNSHATLLVISFAVGLVYSLK